MNILATILLNVSLLTGNPTTEQANISVFVQNQTTGEVIDSYRESNVVPPASVMKLLTTGAALEILGPDYRFETTLEYAGDIRDSVLVGDLYIRGGCDPMLGYQGDTLFLTQWTEAVHTAGIRTIEGCVIADLTMLNHDAHNPFWLCEDVGNYYAPGVYALNYWGNSLQITLKSGEVGSEASVLSTEPIVRDVQFINHVRCTKITYDSAYVSGFPYSYERFISGAIPANKGSFTIKGDIPNPGLLLAEHFTERLRTSGIEVQGEAAYETEPRIFSVERETIYVHYSPLLSDIIRETNIYSNNLFAETLFRFLGTRKALPGSIQSSRTLIKEYWTQRGVDLEHAIIKDGCGLAPQNAVSAKAFVQLLALMKQSPNYDIWMGSLPVSGYSGTLKSLCAKTPLQGRIHAKSGTISGTKNYAGYIDMPNGETWTFAVLVNAAAGKAKDIQKVIQDYLLDVYKKHP